MTSLCAWCMGTSSHIITDDFIVCRCTGTSSHIITADFKHMPGAVWVRASSGPSLRVGLGLHLFIKPGWQLTALSRMARESRCCASQLWCDWLWTGRCVHSGCLLWCVGIAGMGAVAADWGVAGATHGTGCITWVAGRCVGVAMFVVMCLSGLMASRWCLQMWSWAHWYCPPPMTWTMYDPWSAVQMTVAGSHSIWHHWEQIQSVWQTVGPSVRNLDGHGLLCSGRHAGLGSHSQQ